MTALPLADVARITSDPARGPDPRQSTADARRGSSAARYTGRWERLLLRAARAAPDTTTRAVWLQAGRLFCDLRVPPDRPDLRGADSLAELSLAQLIWLSRQQGFAGHLEVVDDLCAWQRHIDFQPPPALPDVGRMRAERGFVIESGVFSEYVEEWLLIEEATQDCLACKLLVEGAAGERPLRQGFLVALGDSFMFALERALPCARLAELLPAAFVRHEREALVAVLDFEISLGTRHAGDVPWQVTLSTLPLLEGRSLFAMAPLAQAGLAFPVPARAGLTGRRLHWLVDEIGEEFQWLD